MVSITSIISFAIVLLAASSYSAPIDIQPDSSTLPVKNLNTQPVASKVCHCLSRLRRNILFSKQIFFFSGNPTMNQPVCPLIAKIDHLKKKTVMK